MPADTLPLTTRLAAARALDDLCAARLTVALIPSRQPATAQRGGMIRVAVESNPGWYRSLCADYQTGKPSHARRTGRKPDTLIKRAHVARALREIATGRAATLYAHRILPYIPGI